MLHVQKYCTITIDYDSICTLNTNILKNTNKPYVQSLFIILWIFCVCRKFTTPSFSNHSDLIASDVIIMTTQLVNTNLPGIPKRTITAPHVSSSGASKAYPCALLSFLTCIKRCSVHKTMMQRTSNCFRNILINKCIYCAITQPSLCSLLHCILQLPCMPVLLLLFFPQ